MKFRFFRKGDVTPMPLALIWLVILMLVLGVIYVLASKSAGGLSSLTSELRDCLAEEVTECIVKLI